MKILVARIPEEGFHYKGDEDGSILQLDGERFVRDAREVYYELYAQHVSEELVVRGSLRVEIEVQCARCLEFFWTTVTVSDFLRAYPAPEGVDYVDISEDLREEILLNVPSFALCDESCKGVCPQCGVGLNKESCECGKDEGLNPWSALDGLNL